MDVPLNNAQVYKDVCRAFKACLQETAPFDGEEVVEFLSGSRSSAPREKKPKDPRVRVVEKYAGGEGRIISDNMGILEFWRGR